MCNRLENGADATLTDEGGDTALDIAKTHARKDDSNTIVPMLEVRSPS